VNDSFQLIAHYDASEPTLYIRVSRGYTPKNKTEKKYYQSTKKGNLLLRNKLSNNKNLNEEVSYE